MNELEASTVILGKALIDSQLADLFRLLAFDHIGHSLATDVAAGMRRGSLVSPESTQQATRQLTAEA